MRACHGKKPARNPMLKIGQVNCSKPANKTFILNLVSLLLASALIIVPTPLVNGKKFREAQTPASQGASLTTANLRFALNSLYFSTILKINYIIIELENA